MDNDLISRSEAEKLGATCLARRNENGQLEAIISLDNAPTVKFSLLPADESKDEAYMRGYEKGLAVGLLKARPKGEWGPCYGNYKNGMFYRDCSICGKATMTGDWKFCPNCGADMRKGGAE